MKQLKYLTIKDIDNQAEILSKDNEMLFPPIDVELLAERLGIYIGATRVYDKSFMGTLIPVKKNYNN